MKCNCYRRFIDLLSGTKREWYLTKQGWIRSREPRVVDRVRAMMTEAYGVEGCISEISYAFDLTPGYDQSIRDDLLSACGLAANE